MPVTEYIWDDVNDCVLEECDETGATQVTYTHEPGPFGPLLSETRDGVESYHHYDALGSTTMLTNDAGDVTDTFAYDAWGNQIARTGTTPTPYTWCGRWGYQDGSATTGGYYVRARDYQPTVARWVSIDPLTFVDGPNLYLYSSDSPHNTADPSGWTEWCCKFESNNQQTVGNQVPSPNVRYVRYGLPSDLPPSLLDPNDGYQVCEYYRRWQSMTARLVSFSGLLTSNSPCPPNQATCNFEICAAPIPGYAPSSHLYI